jgi:NADPH2:quinone reductase
VKAIRIHTHGGPEVLRLDEVPVPGPGPGEALVRTEAAGVNFLDVYQRHGLYPIELPFTLGMEGAGTIERVGPGCAFAPGDRVGWSLHAGAYAEYTTVPASKLVRLPDTIDSKTAAAVLLQGITAEYLCESTFPVQAGQTVLLHAGAGGVGLLLIQLLKLKGARVLTTVSNPEKAKLAREAGADEAILYRETDFVKAVRKLTNEQGVNVVYDSVGRDTYEGSLEILSPRGMLVLFGQASGAVPPIDPLVLSRGGSLFLTRPSLAHYTATREEHTQRATRVFDWVATGALQVRISSVYPLADLPKAHRDLESRRTTGKLVIQL